MSPTLNPIRRPRAAATRARPVAALTLLTTLVLATAASAAASPEPSWDARYSPGEMDLGQDVAVDRDGNVYVAGIGDSNGRQNIVLVKFNDTGGREWVRTVDESDRDRAEGVVTDRSGNVYVAGTTNTAAGDQVMILKYDSAGTPVWSTTLQKGTSESARAIALAPDGNVLVAGVSLSMNGGDGFVAKFKGTTGDEIWARPINMYYMEEAFGVASDTDGNALVTGRVLRDGSFEPFLRKLNGDGVVLWTKIEGTPGRAEGRGVAADADGNAYVVGTRTTVVGNDTRYDVRVLKYAPDGNRVWDRSFDMGGGDDEGRSLVVDASGNLLVTGFGMIDGSKNAFVLKLDADGREIWRQVWESSGIGGAGGVDASMDGTRYAIAGAEERSGTDFDFFAVAYDQGRPTASFNVATASPEAGAPVSFRDTSRPDLVPLTSWRWDFGDGGTATAQNPSHTYEHGGTYRVSLTVRDAWGNADTRTITVSVDGPEAPDDTGNDGNEQNPPDGTDGGDPPGGSGRGIPAPAMPLVIAFVAIVALARRRR